MRKQILACLLTAFGFGWGASAASGQETVRIGLIVPLTGGQASTGKQLDNAVKLYMRQHGDIVAGKKIEVIVRDDGAIPDNTKRIAQELIVNDKVQIIAGFGITPAALAAAPLATQAKIPRDRDAGRRFDRDGTVALYRPDQFHPGAVGRHHR